MPDGPWWSAEDDSTLLRLWGEGLSAAQIVAQGALEQKRTRNAVIGRIHRLRSKTDRQRSQPRTPRSKRAPTQRGIVRINKKCARTRMDTPEPIKSLNVPFLDRRQGQCRAITDATRFEQKCCGHPVDAGGVYCQWHTKLHHQPRGRGA